jgi:hypothetical protein
MPGCDYGESRNHIRAYEVEQYRIEFHADGGCKVLRD